MAGKISDLTAATSMTETDKLELLQAGDNLSLTRKILLQGAATPAANHIIRYNSSLATPAYESVDRRWRVLATGSTAGVEGYTAAPPSTSTITVTAVLQAIAPAGTPLRYIIGGVTSYGIVTASSGTTLTISGPSLSASMTELAIGSLDMVKNIRIAVPTTYGALATQMQAGQYIWLGPPASIVAYQMSVGTAYATTKPVLQLRVNASGTYVSTSALTMTTAFTIYTPTVATFSTTGAAVTYGQVIEPWCPTTAGTGTAGTNLAVDIALVVN